MSRPTILLIEEDAYFSQILKRTLEERGFDVLWSANGEDGVRQAISSRPAVIILALMISKKDGFQVLEELKSHEETKRIHVVMLTRMSQREDIQRCLQAGACEYMIKAHHTPDDVVRRVERLVEKPNGFSVAEFIVVIGLACVLGFAAFFQYRSYEAKRQALQATGSASTTVQVLER